MPHLTPFDRALLVYRQYPTSRDCGEDVLSHLRNGHVIATPTAFVAFRPVLRDSPAAMILDPEVQFPIVDCWHVWLAAGDWRWLLADFLPYRLPWMSWERQFRLRFWPLEKLLAKACRVSLSEHHGQRRQQGRAGRVKKSAPANECVQRAVDAFGAEPIQEAIPFPGSAGG